MCKNMFWVKLIVILNPLAKLILRTVSNKVTYLHVFIIHIFICWLYKKNAKYHNLVWRGYKSGIIEATVQTAWLGLLCFSWSLSRSIGWIKCSAESNWNCLCCLLAQKHTPISIHKVQQNCYLCSGDHFWSNVFCAIIYICWNVLSSHSLPVYVDPMN